MDADAWKRLKGVFEGAVALDPVGRELYLDRACGADHELRARVEEMIRQDSREDGRLEPLTPDLGDPRPESFPLRVGPYTLERVIGHGGMGTVFLARRTDAHFTKRVALKLIRRGMDTDDILRRFRSERQMLADLEHPGIARLLDGGATEDGRPYLVMEHVEGVALDRHCAERRAGLRERVQLFQEICAAVRHAHERRIVHRDLKPANVLVNAGGQPKLLDFGIAKVLDLSGSSSTADLTATEQRLMTLEYASPEQIRGGKITTASDVYGLGVLLYELITGRRPHGATARQRAELERQILEDEPLRPSAAVSEPASDALRPGGATTGRLRRELRGDLDTIVLMALRKEPERRYPSAAELAEDLARWLAGRPVLAQRDTWRYRSAKFVRRNRVLVGATLAVLLALTAGLIVSLALFLETEAERERGIQREYEADLAAATLALRNWNVADARRWLEAAPAALRGWEWRHLWSRCDRSLRTLQGPTGPVHAVAWSPDGRWIASGDEGRVVRVWDARSGAEWASWKDSPNTALDLRFSPDGSRLAALIEKHGIQVWDVSSRETVETWKEPVRPEGFEFGPAGLWIAHSTSIDATSRILVRGLSSEELTLEVAPRRTTALAFSPHGQLVLATLQDWTNEKDSILRQWDLRLGSSSDLALGAPCTALCIDPDGKRAACGLVSGLVLVLDLASGASELLRFQASEAAVHSLAFSPDGRILATGLADGAIRTWDSETGAELGLLLGHESSPTDSGGGRSVLALAFSPDGTQLVSGAADKTLKLWNPRAVDVRTIQGVGFWYSALGVNPEGTRIAVPDCDPERDRIGVVVRERSTGVPLWSRVDWAGRTVNPSEGGLHDAEWHPSGTELALGFWDGRIVFLEAEDGRTLREWNANERVGAIAFHPGGRLLASGGPGSIWLWDSLSGDLVRELPRGKEAGLHDLCFSPDGRLLLAAVKFGGPELWNLESGDPMVVLSAGGQWRGAFRPDGMQAATASWDGTISLWRVPDGTLEATLRGHSARVYGVDYSPDGKRLASGSSDTTVKIWDPQAGRELATLYGHHVRVDRVAFTPDGRCLVSIDLEGVIKFWEAPEQAGD